MVLIVTVQRAGESRRKGIIVTALGQHQGVPMKKLLVAMVATLVAVSVAGCAAVGKGKGKAPPPIVTKG
jgi:hypothetical protein